MAGNFEFALGHVHEGFVMFIGSDDGITPDAINYVDSIVKKFNVDAVSCKQAMYIWPDFHDQEIAGQLKFATIRDDIEIRQSDDWIKKTLNFEVLYCFDLPNLYCGFVHKRIIDKAYKDGVYFRSITPDAYSAFATAIFIDKYAFSYKPFSIAGASSKSNGASSLHSVGNNTESNKFLSENDIPFCDNFINCPSFEIILGETFAKLSIYFPELCSKYEINYQKMLIKAKQNTNARTQNQVYSAVEIMHENFSDKIKTSYSPSRSKLIHLKLINFLSAFLRFNKVIGVQNSSALSINDVDDAALFIHFIQNFPNKVKYTTVGNLILKKILSYFNNQISP